MGAVAVPPRPRGGRNRSGRNGFRGVEFVTLKWSLRWHLFPFLVALPALLIALSGETVGAVMQYERPAVSDGEVWRLVTGHWVHLGWRHLALNLAGLFLVWHLFGRMLPLAGWLAVLLVIALSQSAALMVFHPEVLWYVGLSGLLHGLLAAGALAALRHMPLVGAGALLLLLAKLALETLQPGVGIAGAGDWLGGPVVVESHRYGALAGLLIGAPAVWCTARQAARRAGEA